MLLFGRNPWLRRMVHESVNMPTQSMQKSDGHHVLLGSFQLVNSRCLPLSSSEPSLHPSCGDGSGGGCGCAHRGRCTSLHRPDASRLSVLPATPPPATPEDRAEAAGDLACGPEGRAEHASPGGAETQVYLIAHVTTGLWDTGWWPLPPSY